MHEPLSAAPLKERERGDEDVVDVVARQSTVLVNEVKTKVQPAAGMWLEASARALLGTSCLTVCRAGRGSDACSAPARST